MTLKDRIYKYLLRTHGWVSSGELQRLVAQHTKYTPRSAVRRVQELFNEGKVEREIRKNHAFYKAKRVERVSVKDLLSWSREAIEEFDKM